ncbi:long-chain fatty acid--CoA ligase [Acidithiobacillus sp. CV18-2]|uniref:Long-chain fatty acid--CoA ligase n=1 Tax=Igneacidithiobacillus copahuensis TaxID=2724909 RepID=A0AAE3CJF4_9PROT|nr:long-chain fatty acid--CoA ligase [Igneacidithiobacillus copahuensis]MBU2755495.1 long-chain fatty acid--CoA ligase [Acidithiobacillus sp. CV18-3]MBU2757834.1 long-chain fatty acid--CoA ligase [Acidithiobacillus sp. BN09-2]MBU2777901.1 long-chain fatty acid--CoA ligase [Acidithiobacillus sp. CV18-2]MBU2797827.1 long-chain fatty acid--CoA ligase [Acidithiobacillus sp. VAN18-2]MBU2799327.1 long-chain fatty acid--CoA ligase [Acidithiobacillus sp. VAN18-4]UTV80615.1 long-chain fatty acid--CoA 
MALSVTGLDHLAAGLFARCQRDPDGNIAWQRVGEQFLPLRAADFAESVRRRARGLIRLGVRRGDRVLLMAANSVDWAILDFAILSIGAVTVPLYASLGAREIHYVLGDCSPSVILLQNQEIYSRLEPAAWGVAPGHVFLQEAAAGLADWQDLDTLGGDEEAPAFPADPLRRQDLASIVYTSGTTGWPKGVMLSHGNFLSNIEGFLHLVPLRAGQRLLSVLPLSHVFERATGHFGGYLLGLETAYAERPDTVLRDLATTHPDLLIAVPRIFQVLYERTLRTLNDRHDWLGKFLRQGMGLEGKTAAHWQQATSSYLLRKQLRKKLGGRLQYFVSGGAALDPTIAQFFLRLDLPILEGYGMTEASPVIAANPLNAIHPGSVGKPLPNLELRIADDGQILVRGPSIMQGYWNNDAATRETVVEGWLHTGDVGELDVDGYLHITERKKEIIVNSAGENIAPQKIELRLCSQPLIAQAVVFGDHLPYLIALLYPNPEIVRDTLGESVDARQLEHALRQAVHQALQGLPSFEQVRRFAILREPLSESGGTLTPTLKVKRRRVAEQYAAELAALQR